MIEPQPPLRAIHGDAPAELVGWPASIPAVAQLLSSGLELSAATVLIGENGSGKSTLVEGIAGAFGLSVEGGSTGARLTTRASESALANHLTLVRNPGASRRGYFLRGETAHGLFTYLERHPGKGHEPRFHEMSHGESFLSLVETKFLGEGLWVLDEPEAALSFRGCIRLLKILSASLADGGSQVLMATHSPVLAALPGARLLEVGEWGMRSTAWPDSELTMAWRGFMNGPERYLESTRGR